MNPHGFNFVCLNCKVKITSEMTARVKRYKDSDYADNILGLLSTIEGLCSTIEPYGFDRSKENSIFEYIRQMKILAMFRINHYAHHIKVVNLTHGWLSRYNEFDVEPMYDEAAIKGNWDKFGRYVGGYSGCPRRDELLERLGRNGKSNKLLSNSHSSM